MVFDTLVETLRSEPVSFCRHAEHDGKQNNQSHNFYPKTPPLNTMIFNKNKINNINLKIEPRVNVFTKISKSELPNIERNDEIIDPYCRRKCKDSQPINKNNSSSYSSKSQYSLAVNNNSRRITIPNVNYDGYRKKYMKK